MRLPALLLLAQVAGISGGLLAAEATSVTIVMEFEGHYSYSAVDEMKRESEAVLKDAGKQLHWSFRQDFDNSKPTNDLVVVKFKGNCAMENFPMLLDERGPLAYTHSTEGQVLPYSEVSCDKVRNSIRRVMHGGDYSRGEELMGRAIGRVLAHELYHIFANTKKHGSEGVAKTALSPRNLISEKLVLNEHDVHRIEKNFK